MLAGIDTHKDTLAVAVIDDAGRPLVVTEPANTEAGYPLEQLLTADAETRVGIEGSGNLGRGAAVHLVLTGPAQWSRCHPRRPARSAPAGRARARPTRWMRPRSPGSPPGSRPCRRSGRRSGRPQTAGHWPTTALGWSPSALSWASRTHSELRGLLPGYQAWIPRLTAPTVITKVKDLLAGQTSVRALLTRRRRTRLAELTVEIRKVADLITAAVAEVDTGLTELYGLGPVGAASILGEVADVRHYRFRHSFAAANGIEPLPVSSARTSSHRLNRSGNSTLNRVLYTMATPRSAPTPKAVPTTCANARRQDRTGRPLRCLKRRLSDVVHKTVHEDLAAGRAPTETGR